MANVSLQVVQKDDRQKDGQPNAEEHFAKVYLISMKEGLMELVISEAASFVLGSDL